MSNLLARFAENIYWLARYLERAENLARVLEINETYARDASTGPNWERVLDLYSDTDRFGESHEEITANSVLWFYLYDRDNPSSVSSSIHQARENARTVRHLISTEMWTQLNMFHTDFTEMRKSRVTTSNLSRIARFVIDGCQSFEGIAEGTFFRGEPWRFYQLGKYIERADQTTRILDMGYDRLTPAEGDAVAWSHWNVLLRSVSGYHAYRSRHPGASSPHDIVSFLLYDPEFPRAVAMCLDPITRRLRELARYHRKRQKLSVEPKRRALAFLIETGPGKDILADDLHAYVDDIQAALANLSSEIATCYFRGL